MDFDGFFLLFTLILQVPFEKGSIRGKHPFTSFTVRKLQMPNCSPSQAFLFGKILTNLNCKSVSQHAGNVKMVMSP